MTTGKFYKSGGKLYTNYPETGEAAYQLIDDFYGSTFSAYGGFAKSAGAATYAHGFGRDGYPTAGSDAYFNAVMGKEITLAMFTTDNIYTALGARPYQREGVRISDKLPSYGTAADYNITTTGKDASTVFLGAGAITTQDGNLPPSVRLPVDEFRQPAKDITFAFDYGLHLQALERHEDDTIQYKAYVESMSTAFSDLIDKTLLRPLNCPQPVVDGIETSLNGIARCIASGTEAEVESTSSADEPKATDGEVDAKNITSGMVSPYGGYSGDFFRKRSGASTHKLNNFDGNVVDVGNKSLDLLDMRKLYRVCSINWKDSANPNNKVFAMSNIAQDKLGAIMVTNNILLDTQYVQRDFNGVKLIPGRDVGLLVNTFQNIPIIQDGNFNFDFSASRVSDTKFGEIMLLDLDHIWMSMLTPVELFNNNNPLVTNKLIEKNLMVMRAETRIDSFIQHGRIKNISDNA